MESSGGIWNSSYGTVSSVRVQFKVSLYIIFFRDGHSACIIGNAMLIFGGYAENVANSPDVYKLDLCHFEWSLVRCSDEPPLYRDFHTATAIGNRMYIFGGRSDNQFWQNQSEFYSDKLVYLVRTYLFHRVFAIMYSSDVFVQGSNDVAMGAAIHFFSKA